MKPTYFLSCLLAFSFSTVVSSQSVYNFQYNFNQPGDTVTYNAFLVRYEDGSGLLRVRYALPATGETIVAEADVDERFHTDTITGITDTSHFFLAPSRPRFIVGNAGTVFNAPCLRFLYNSANGFYDPVGVTHSVAETVMNPQTFFRAVLVERAGLTQQFVSAFFSADEEFYINLFKPGTRGLTPLEKNTRLFLLVVADTLDADIGHSCSKDMDRVVATFKGVTDYLGIKFLPQTIAGDAYSKNNVEMALSKLAPSANDIVVFYYSGHGFRLQDQHKFPFIKLKTHHTSRQDVLANSLNMEDIYNTVKKKPSRCNLVISDCCNSDIETTNAKGTQPGKTKGSGVEWSEDNIRTLFLNKTRTSLLATAADYGQKASSNDNFGGFFSYFFKTSLEDNCSKLKTNVNWFSVMQQTQTQTTNKALHTYCDKPYVPENICNQTPLYKIEQGN